MIQYAARNCKRIEPVARDMPVVFCTLASLLLQRNSSPGAFGYVVLQKMALGTCLAHRFDA